jgi:hypothetical protein
MITGVCMKKAFIMFSISVGAFLIGAVTFSIFKAVKWAKHFNMTYLEFSYQLGIAVKLLQLGKTVEYIKLQTGVDFTYEEMRKYFINNEIYKGNKFHIYKGEKEA